MLINNIAKEHTADAYEYDWLSSDDQDVINISYDELAQEITENIADEILEHQWSVRNTIRYYLVLMVSRAGAESGLPLVPSKNLNNTVCASEIQLSENVCRLELF